MGKLYRSRDDIKLFGVCGGLGEYFGVSSLKLRIIWAILTLPTGGTNIIVYILACFLMPKNEKIPKVVVVEKNKSDEIQVEGDSFDKDESVIDENEIVKRQKRSREKMGITLILLGVFFLSRNFLMWIELKHIIPTILVIIGAYILYKKEGKNEQ